VSQAHTTTDHETIRRWAEERGGHPAAVRATHRGRDPGMLRIDFEANGPEEGLEEISWDEFFEKFDDAKLAFLYQDETKDGATSRFFKFVERDSEKQKRH
jgi:hypothetical protein